MRIGHLFALILGWGLLGWNSLQAVPSSDLKARYEPIVARNPFGLKPPAPPVTNAPVQQLPVNDKKVEIFLTGITSVGAPVIPKKAYLIVKEQGSKKDTNYLSMKEGDKISGIEVLAINDKDRTVRIASADLGEVLLSFKTHGLTNPIVPMQPVAARPGMPGVPGGVPPPPMGVPGQNLQPGMQPGAPPPLNTPTDFNNPAASSYTPNVPGNNRTIPSRSMRGGQTPGVPNFQPGPEQSFQQEPEVDAAQQYINLRAREELARRQGMTFPPTPPPP